MFAINDLGDILRAIELLFLFWTAVWFACGFFSLIMIKKADDAAGNHPYLGCYWLKGRTYSRLLTGLIIFSGLVVLPIGIWAMCEWLLKREKEHKDQNALHW